MKLGILSDTHDRVERTQTAIKKIKELGVDEIFHCGDLCAPFMIDVLVEAAGETPIHIIFGNIDDRRREQKKSEQLPTVTHHGDVAALKLGGLMLGAAHEPEDAQKLIDTAGYDVVLHGHTHQRREERLQIPVRGGEPGETHEVLVINPGEIIGRKERPGFAILDINEETKEKHVTFYDVE